MASTTPFTNASAPAASEAPAASLRAIHEFPNFDYLRLIAAASVMFSHAFTIAYGGEDREPLVQLIGSNDNITGIYGVCVFFIISGFLITMSAANSRSVTQYVASRVLRIYPALIVCQTGCALVLGAFFSTSGPVAYIKALDWLRYGFWYSIDVAMSWEIPTVIFYDDGRDGGTGLNGSLWTIQQELFCYVLIGLLLFTRQLKWWAAAIIFVVSAPWLFPGLRAFLRWNRDDVEQILAAFNSYLYDDFPEHWGLAAALVCLLVGLVLTRRSKMGRPIAILSGSLFALILLRMYLAHIWWTLAEARVYDYMWVGASFFIGSLIFFLWRRRDALPAWPMLLCALVFAYACYRWRFYDLFPLYAAYPLLYVATAQRHTLPSLKKFGDISYGLYLYGWPAEQAVRGWWGPGIAWWQLLGLSLLLAGIAAYLSWHIVEKPMLSLKRYFRQKLPDPALVALPA